jgi:uncharacterized protein YjdB
MAVTLRKANTIQIPKPNQQQGLGIGWPAQETDMDKLKKYFEEIKAKI